LENQEVKEFTEKERLKAQILLKQTALGSLVENAEPKCEKALAESRITQKHFDDFVMTVQMADELHDRVQGGEVSEELLKEFKTVYDWIQEKVMELASEEIVIENQESRVINPRAVGEAVKDESGDNLQEQKSEQEREQKKMNSSLDKPIDKVSESAVIREQERLSKKREQRYQPNSLEKEGELEMALDHLYEKYFTELKQTGKASKEILEAIKENEDDLLKTKDGKMQEIKNTVEAIKNEARRNVGYQREGEKKEEPRRSSSDVPKEALRAKAEKWIEARNEQGRIEARQTPDDLDGEARERIAVKKRQRKTAARAEKNKSVSESARTESSEKEEMKLIELTKNYLDALRQKVEILPSWQEYDEEDKNNFLKMEGRIFLKQLLKEIGWPQNKVKNVIDKIITS
jgi:hypothetical protein